MNRKTPNPQRRAPNTKFRSWRVAEIPDGEYDSRRKPAYDLEDRLLEFAANIVELTEALPNTRAGNHIAGQLLRCGTSSLPNHGEVEAAESRRDFLHKLRICLKELRETKRWLRLVGRVKKHVRRFLVLPLGVERWTLSVARFLVLPLGVGRFLS
jgi:four helix bundle protein